MPAWKFFLVTFGCKVNQYETEALREAWLRLGGEECDDPAQATVVCVNSCAITAKGERDARNAVYRLRREAPQARLILTGCAARLFADYHPRRGAFWAAPDLLLPQEHKSLLLQGPWPDSATTGADAAANPNTIFPPFAIAGFKRARPVLKVQDGCAHRCTYCIVPLTRGRPRSRPVADIVDEARRLLAAGHAEIMLSGINLAQYGRDADTGDFWRLLTTLDAALAPEYAGQARLRISSLEPGQLGPRGLDALRACRLLCPHLHISLQHASRRVLKRMGRGHYTAAMLAQAVDALARHWPHMGLGVDVIAGFPGETEEDVRLLEDFLETLPLTYAHVFPYSRRPGTAADRFTDQLPHKEKLERAARLRALATRKQQDFLQAQLALPRMLLAPDARVSNGAAPGRTGGLPHGVNEYYAACRLRPAPEQSPQKDHAGDGLLPVRPVAALDRELLVEPLPEV